MHRITSKRQHLTQDNVQFNGTLNVGYDLSYTYSSEEGKKINMEFKRNNQLYKTFIILYIRVLLLRVRFSLIS